MSAIRQFTVVWTRGNATTRRVLQAVPAEQSEFRPAANTRTTRKLSFIFSLGQGGIAAPLTNQWQWPPPFPATPPTWSDVLDAFDATSRRCRRCSRSIPTICAAQSFDFRIRHSGENRPEVQRLNVSRQRKLTL